jgi:hypothetical protein
MNLSHGLDWASLLPAAKYAGSWTWPCLGVAALVAAHATISEPRSQACPRASLSFDTLVCLGDGGMLDPATSLIWRAAAPDAHCVDIGPLAEWRLATPAEISKLPARSFETGAMVARALCVNDTLARIRNAETGWSPFHRGLQLRN